ncbi:MAG: hypothetical protein HOV92_00650 [Streptomyces sp.]|nr:hypothetical protein [Streptomyces sp.]
MKLVSAAKHAALQTLQQRTARDLEAAEKAAAERLATINRLRAELEQARDTHPDSPLPQPPATPGDVELRRRLNLALRTIREQDARLDQLQTSHVADTRELHDLRQGVAS